MTVLVASSLASLPSLAPTVSLSLMVTAIWTPMIAFLIAALAEFLAIRLFKARGTMNEGTLVVTLCLYQACIDFGLGIGIAGAPTLLAQAFFPTYLLVLTSLTLAALADIRLWQALACAILALPAALAGACFMVSINMWVPRLAVP
ncbi:MAG: hypothetical protein A2Z30_04030 [Chloroflexi bacterium RBG_16_64_43]|nr:MAG: hypothetical protein A2Z30_04030 [Chloroflexi bacterium RBG_16_64_43]